MIFAWQGWTLDIPESWNPVRLEGDFKNGHALIADLHHPRLGIRWTTHKRKFDARAALVGEIGALAADEAKRCRDDDRWRGGMLYTEPDPPGRDVWLAESAQSGRVVELIHHVQARGSDVLGGIRDSLHDSPPSSPLKWAVFQLSCASPTGFHLQRHQLNAGDLSLTFARIRQHVSVRQIALASLALKRMDLEKWLGEQERRHLRTHRPCGPAHSSAITTADGRTLAGAAGSMERRRRFFWNRALPPAIFIAALHDVSRDRLVIADASSRELLEDVCRTIGWAECGSQSPGRNSRASSSLRPDRSESPPPASSAPPTARQR